MLKPPHAVSLALLLWLAPAQALAKPQASKPNATPAGSTAVPSVPEDRTSAARSRSRAKKPELAPCLAKPVQLTRQLGDEIEARELSLTFCDGRPNPAALDSLSVLARSRAVARPLPAELRSYQRLPTGKGPPDRRRDPAYVSREVMRLHTGLLERLQRVVDHFPGQRIELVSGHRPESRDTSRHHHGRALDFRLAGVRRERLRDFLRTVEATGVGYYPNSSFVHMDVRDDKGYWVDRSGPGERPDYGSWPPPRREIEGAQQRILQDALAALSALGSPTLRPDAARSASPIVATSPLRVAPHPARARPVLADEPRETGDEMSAAEVLRIRRDALKALETLRWDEPARP